MGQSGIGSCPRLQFRAQAIPFLTDQMIKARYKGSELQNAIELQSKEEGVLKSIKALAQEIAPLYDKLNTSIVRKEGAAEFIELLESVGKRGGVTVTIQAVEKADHSTVNNLESLKVTLSAIGSWESVVRFLGLLEFLPYQTSIEQAVLSRGDKDWRIDVSLTVLKERS